MQGEILDVSVVICTYTEERWDNLIDAIESIQKQFTPPREIIVVVDHNTYMLEKVQSSIPDVIAIENSERQGLSGSRNSGIAIARGTLVAFMDDDAIAEPNWLASLYQYCADPQILGTGGEVKPLWEGKRPAWFPEEFSWVVGCSYLGLPKIATKVRNPYGGCTCMKREVFESIGGFRNGIGRIGKRPLGGEETELCIRARLHWPEKFFFYEPSARIYHRVPRYRANWQYFRSRCYAEGLSKAFISRLVGAKGSLTVESNYTLVILPAGIVRGLADAFFRFDPVGFQKAGAIVIGFLITVAGYIVGMLSQHKFLDKGEQTCTDHKSPSPTKEPAAGR